MDRGYPMNAHLRWLPAVIVSVLALSGAGVARPAPALAQGLPYWQPGNTYANIWSTPGFTGSMPTNRPTDAVPPLPQVQPTALQWPWSLAPQISGVNLG